MNTSPLPEPAGPRPQPWRCERHTAPDTACDPVPDCEPAWDVPFGPVIEGVPLPAGRSVVDVTFNSEATELLATPKDPRNENP